MADEWHWWFLSNLNSWNCGLVQVRDLKKCLTPAPLLQVQCWSSFLQAESKIHIYFFQNHFCVKLWRHLRKTVAQGVWKRMITVDFLILLKALSLKYSRVFFDFITAAWSFWEEICRNSKLESYSLKSGVLWEGTNHKRPGGGSDRFHKT